MSDDRYEPGDQRTLMAYPCGLRAGDRLRLRAELPIVDHLGAPTGSFHAAGPLWTVVPGLPGEPDVVWLHQPDGRLHTWDDSVLDTFERIAEAPAAGSRVRVVALPPGIDRMPHETRNVFQQALGATLPVIEIDSNGLVVLEVRSKSTAETWEGEDIRIEAELLRASS